MSLGQWCRDYIFYPIAMSKTFSRAGKKLRGVFGDRVGKLVPTIVAQLITFTIIGIWHGSEFKYLAFGLYQAVFILGGILFDPYFDKINKALHINTEAPSFTLFRMARTFAISTGGRYFSRANRFLAAVYMFRSSLVFNPEIFFNGEIFELGLNVREFQVLAVCLLFWLCISIAQEKGYKIREELAKQNIVFRWMVYIVGILALLIFGVYGSEYNASSFIYREF